MTEPAIENETHSKAKGPSTRSPNYPYFDLERSVSRASQLYERERLHLTPVMTALKHWGYSNSTGKAGMTLSSLKHFGLLEDSGRGDERQVRLTTRAYDILHTPDDEERANLLREAALAPEIHREMWDQYGAELPSTGSLAWTLMKTRGFTKTGAEDFIRQWARTMDFARLAESASDNQRDSETVGDFRAADLESDPALAERVRHGRKIADEVLSRDASSQRTSSSEVPVGDPLVQRYPIPVALYGRPPVIISGAFPLSEAEWAQFKAVLDAMKPVLVGDPPASGVDSSEQ